MNLKAAPGSSLEQMEERVTAVEKLIRKTVGSDEIAMIVSNIGVVPDFSAIYNSNSSPHTAFVLVSLKEGHATPSQTHMNRMREAMRNDMPDLIAYFQSGGFVDAVLNFGTPAPVAPYTPPPQL